MPGQPDFPPPAGGRSEPSTWRWLLLVGALGLVAVGAGLGGLFAATSYEQALELGKIVYHEDGFRQLALPLTPGRYQMLQLVLLGAGALGVMLTLVARGAADGFGRELGRAGRRLRDWWGRLPGAAQAGALGLLALLVAVRGWYLLNYPLGTDEIASYDFFVRRGVMAISSFYPIPNNHLLYNLLAWPLAEAGLSPRLVMRLPTLVLGTAGTAAGYALLARLAGLRTATLVTALVGLSPLWAYYGAVGRGYFLQFCLLQLGFFAVLELLQAASPYRRLAWLTFIASSVLGLYAIPTYAYPLAGLGLGLGAGLICQRRYGRLGQAVLAGVIILVLTLLLYAPVGMVSGWEQLIANRYVKAKSAAEFWPPFRAVLYETAAELFGPSLRLSGPAWLGAALLGGAAAWRGLPAGPRRRAALLAWVLLALPLLLMALQRVNAPVRVLLYLTYCGYLLAALLLAGRPGRRWLPRRWRWALLLAAGLGLSGWRLYRHQTQVQASRQETRQIQQAYRWLSSQTRHPAAPARVWLHAPLHELFFAHYAGQPGAARLRLRSSRHEAPASAYDFLVYDQQARATACPGPGYGRVFQNGRTTIYAPRPAASAPQAPGR